MTYSVYALFRPDTAQVFYIGAGRGRMPWRHVRERFRPDGNRAKNALICELIDERGYDDIPVIIV